MTCGACDPQAFHHCYGGIKKGKRILGYTVLSDGAVAFPDRELYEMGAELVFFDRQPALELPFFSRPTVQMMQPLYLREGDVLLIDRLDVLGTRELQRKAIIHKFAKFGIRVFHMKETHNG